MAQKFQNSLGILKVPSYMDVANLPGVLVLVATTEHHRLGGLNNIYFVQFWRLEVRDQGASRFRVQQGHSSWLAIGCLITCPHIAQRERSLLSFFL